jgi:solute carrier family 25 aspartate/glutamate transporter 12/13
MEASIIFHFAGRGSDKRLALIDFAQLLNPRWRAPYEEFAPDVQKSTTAALHDIAHSMYNFALGGTTPLIPVL